MAKLSLLAGTTSKTVKIFIQDKTKTDGSGLTGLLFNTASLTAYYIREGASATTVITLATATLGTWATGGFIVVDATNMPGVYELSIPNAAIAAGAKSVVIYLQGGGNMAQTLLEIELTAVDNQATNYGLVNVSANTVQWNGTNVSTPATAGIPDVNAKNINNVATTSVTTINANIGATQPINFSGTGASAFVKGDTEQWAGSAVQAPNVAGTPIVDLKYTLGTPSPAAAGSVRADAVTGAVGSVTGNVGGNVVGSVASVTGAVGSVTGNVGGNVVGSVASVTGNVGGNVSGSVASVLAGGLIDLTTTTYGEPSVAVGASATIKDSIVWLKTLARNKITQSASTQTLFKDDGSTTVSTSSDSDDGTTFTRGKWS